MEAAGANMGKMWAKHGGNVWANDGKILGTKWGNYGNYGLNMGNCGKYGQKMRKIQGRCATL
jgi:hypothetical protein